jgi:LysR family glycine cleavage system transcriptional activator
MTRFPSLDLLRTFILAATHLNVSRAAESLHLTQSAVSRQLKLLEDQLGVVLFARTNRGLTLTQAGQDYFAKIHEPMARIQHATEALTPARTALILGVDGAFARTWLVKRLADFRRLNPDIELDLRLGPSMASVTGANLPSGCDLHIVFGSPPWPGHRAEPLLVLEEFPVCSPGLIAATPLTSPEDLAGQTLIHEGNRVAWRHWLARTGAPDMEGARATIADDSLTCLSMAIEGQGIAIGDNLTCADYLDSGTLVAPFAARVTLKQTFHLAVLESRAEAPSVRRFCAWLKGYFAP